MVQEAGGVVTDLAGEPYNPYQPGIIATNGKIHAQLESVIKGGNI
jgi:myo-inositol-1(or 4)-monophosphatase